jgi:hypothetical protein
MFNYPETGQGLKRSERNKKGAGIADAPNQDSQP